MRRQLEIQQRFISQRVGEHLSDEERSCVLEVESIVELGPDIRDRAATTFGPRMRLLTEIERERVVEGR